MHASYLQVAEQPLEWRGSSDEQSEWSYKYYWNSENCAVAPLRRDSLLCSPLHILVCGDDGSYSFAINFIFSIKGPAR